MRLYAAPAASGHRRAPLIRVAEHLRAEPPGERRRLRQHTPDAGLTVSLVLRLHRSPCSGTSSTTSRPGSKTSGGPTIIRLETGPLRHLESGAAHRILHLQPAPTRPPSQDTPAISSSDSNADTPARQTVPRTPHSTSRPTDDAPPHTPTPSRSVNLPRANWKRPTVDAHPQLPAPAPGRLLALQLVLDHSETRDPKTAVIPGTVPATASTPATPPTPPSRLRRRC